MSDRARFIKAFEYNPETGLFISTTTGRKVGTPVKRWYLSIKFEGHSYRAHRVAWLITYGKWPDGLLDHINGITSDNSIKNLREATISQNAFNAKKGLANRSGEKGVAWNSKKNRWEARVFANGKIRFRRFFNDFNEACKRVRSARAVIHGEFANNG